MIIGVDFGLQRTGFAFSDQSERIAFPGGAIRGGEDESLRGIAEEAERRGAREIVVGVPARLDGTESDMTRRALDFARRLRALTTTPVVTWDERLTSVQAERAMLAGDLSRKKRKRRIDALAAQLMLQNYLDSKRGGEPSGRP